MLLKVFCNGCITADLCHYPCTNAWLFIYLNQILSLCNCKEDVRNKVHSVIDKFAERGLRSLAVARQVSYLD